MNKINSVPGKVRVFRSILRQLCAVWGQSNHVNWRPFHLHTIKHHKRTLGLAPPGSSSNNLRSNVGHHATIILIPTEPDNYFWLLDVQGHFFLQNLPVFFFFSALWDRLAFSMDNNSGQEVSIESFYSDHHRDMVVKSSGLGFGPAQKITGSAVVKASCFPCKGIWSSRTLVGN